MSQMLTHSTESTPKIVFGADITMTTVDGKITLHAPTPYGREAIGTYTSPADAWAALDEFDLPVGDSDESRAA